MIDISPQVLKPEKLRSTVENGVNSLILFWKEVQQCFALGST